MSATYLRPGCTATWNTEVGLTAPVRLICRCGETSWQVRILADTFDEVAGFKQHHLYWAPAHELTARPLRRK